MMTLRFRAGLAAGLFGLALVAGATPTRASGGGSGGGGGAAGGGGGGGGGGGTSTNPLKGVNSFPIALTGTALSPSATGTATLSFNSLGTYRALSVQIQGLDLPDGSVVDVVFIDDGKSTVLYPGVYYSPTVWASQDAGKSVVEAGSASLNLANGDPSVPLFGKNGSIHVVATDAAGNVYELANATYTALGGP